MNVQAGGTPALCLRSVAILSGTAIEVHFIDLYCVVLTVAHLLSHSLSLMKKGTTIGPTAVSLLC